MDKGICTKLLRWIGGREASYSSFKTKPLVIHMRAIGIDDRSYGRFK